MQRLLIGLIACLCAVVTSARAQTVTRVVLADAEVRQGQPNSNFGGSPRLRIVDNQKDPQQWGYLKFDISELVNACNLTATLRVNGQTRSGGTNIPVAAHAVADTSWGEGTITWNNKPALGAVLGSATVLDSTFRWYELDVTQHVRAQYLAGATLVTLALKNSSTVADDDYVEFHARESDSDAELVIQIGPLVAGCTGTFAPLADTFTQDGTGASKNFGSDSHLRVRSSGTTQWSYLKFDVASVSDGITSAKIRLHGRQSDDKITASVSIFSVQNTTWGELTLTWNNQPASSATALSTTVVGSSEAWYEWDVTSYVNDELASGRSVFSVVLKGATPQQEWDFKSRENATNKPYLYIEVGARPNVGYIHVDHLNTPRLISDSTGTTVWRRDNQEPFGDSPPDENPSGLGVFEFDLGFMGQRRDRETGLWYNGQRDGYDAAIGGYTQAEPLGVQGDINLYRYARSNPLSLVDPDGMQAQGAAGFCGPYFIACVVGITAIQYATVTGIKSKSGAANDPCYDDPCERRQKVLLKWYTNLLGSMSANRHVGWNLVLIREAHRYNKVAAQHNAICPQAQVPYIGVYPYFDVIPGGQPPNLSDIYLRGP
jgi:RHS repeat-associated protein